MIVRVSYRLKPLLFVFAALLAGANAWTQATGSLIGTAADNAGALVSDARVSLTNLATNEVKVAQSDAKGNFQFVQLLPGNYKVTVEKNGFQAFVEQPIQVAVGVTSRASAVLQVGSTTETVEVNTEAPL